MIIDKNFCENLHFMGTDDVLKAIMTQLGSRQMQQRRPSRQCPFTLGQIKHRGYDVLAITLNPYVQNSFSISPLNPFRTEQRSTLSQNSQISPIGVRGEYDEIGDGYDAIGEPSSESSPLLGRSRSARTPVTESEQSFLEYFDRIYLTPEETFMLVTYAKIKIYDPLENVPMKTAIGAVFAFMVGLTENFSIEYGDIELAPIILIATTIILYPLLYKTWRSLTHDKSPNLFDNQTLMLTGFKVGMLLVFGLAGFTAANKILPADENSISLTNFYNAAINGSVAGAAFTLIKQIMDWFDGRLFAPRDIRAFSRYLSSILTPSATFPVLLIINLLIQRAYKITPAQAANVSDWRHFLPTAAHTTFGLPIEFTVMNKLLTKLIEYICYALMGFYNLMSHCQLPKLGGKRQGYQPIDSYSPRAAQREQDGVLEEYSTEAPVPGAAAAAPAPQLPPRNGRQRPTSPDNLGSYLDQSS